MVAADTDVELMLLSHWKLLLHEITFTSERRRKFWNIRDIVRIVYKTLQDGLQSHIKVLHAFTGCDPKSAVYARGKTSFLKEIVASDKIRDAMEVISDTWEKPFEIGNAGHKLFLWLERKW